MGIFYCWMKCGELVESGFFIMRESSLFVSRRFLYFRWKLTVTISLAWTFLQFFDLWCEFLVILRMAMVEWKSLCMKDTCAFVNCHVLFVFFSSTSHLFGPSREKTSTNKNHISPVKTNINLAPENWLGLETTFLSFLNGLFSGAMAAMLVLERPFGRGPITLLIGHTVDGGNPAPAGMYETL